MGLEETTDSLEAYKRDCKKMNEEIIGLQEEVDERSAKVIDLDKALKNECAEKADLNADLEECDQMLKLEEAKVVHAQNEAVQTKQELERRVAEKDDEIENVRKTYHKKLEAMQASIQEAEVKAKTELARLKKKFDTDFQEMQRSFDQAKR